MAAFNETQGMNEIELSLPNVLRAKPFTERFTEEVKHFHKWLGVIFYYSDNFPRVLRIISLSTNVMAMLFIQAVTYNLTNPDDGSCELQKTSHTCLAEASPFGSGDSKCYWNPGFKRGSCHFNEPDNSITIILFVAIFAALVSTPIALTADWVIMNVLAAHTRKRVNLSTQKAVETKYKDHLDNATALVPSTQSHHQPLAFQRRSAAVSRTLTTEEPVVGGPAGAAAVVKKRRFSVAAFLQLDVANSLSTSLQEDLSNLLRELCGYREQLTDRQRQEFSELWGLDNNGHFITDVTNNSDSSAFRPRHWLQKASGDSKVQTAITNDLRDVRARLEDESKTFSGKALSEQERGRRMLYLFQRDLLPGVNGRILESKSNREAVTHRSVDASSKLLGWMFIVLLNVGMLFYVYLFAMQQTAVRQDAWFKSFLIWLVTEVFFVSTAVVYFTHFVVPSIIMKDVGKIKQRLLDSIRDYNAQTKAEESQIRGLGPDEESKDGVVESAQKPFNAAAYLFVSYRLAQQYPDLKESKIISRFSTPWPPQSYHHVRDVSKSYSKKFSALTRSASMILIFLVGSLIQIPPSLQDMIINMVSTTVVGYSVLVHIQLFHIFPILIIIPTLLVGIVVHFMIKASRNSASAGLSGLASVAGKSATSFSNNNSNNEKRKKFAGDVGYTAPIEFVNDRGQIESGLALEAVVPSVVSLTHKSRRASTQQGRAVIRQLHQELGGGLEPIEPPLFEYSSSTNDSGSVRSVGDKKDNNNSISHSSERSARRHRGESLEIELSDTSSDSSDPDSGDSEDEERILRNEESDILAEEWVQRKYVNKQSNKKNSFAVTVSRNLNSNSLSNLNTNNNNNNNNNNSNNNIDSNNTNQDDEEKCCDSSDAQSRISSVSTIAMSEHNHSPRVFVRKSNNNSNSHHNSSGHVRAHSDGLLGGSGSGVSVRKSTSFCRVEEVDVSQSLLYTSDEAASGLNNMSNNKSSNINNNINNINNNANNSSSSSAVPLPRRRRLSSSDDSSIAYDSLIEPVIVRNTARAITLGASGIGEGNDSLSEEEKKVKTLSAGVENAVGGNVHTSNDIHSGDISSQQSASTTSVDANRHKVEALLSRFNAKLHINK